MNKFLTLFITSTYFIFLSFGVSASNSLLDSKYWEDATVKQLKRDITNGANIKTSSDKGVSVLMTAASTSKNADVIKILINRGADVNKRDASNGFTALMFAVALNDNPAITKAIIDSGIDVNKRYENNRTVLMIACAYTKNPNIIKMLLDAGADVKAKDSKGYTALTYIEANKFLKDTNIHKTLNTMFYE